jgi:hypothetical protein
VLVVEKMELMEGDVLPLHPDCSLALRPQAGQIRLTVQTLRILRPFCIAFERTCRIRRCDAREAFGSIQE